ncbi:MAG: RDD family protein, partial [Oscillospiraceae bacterium]|nr:RDD family protein [Oscillospiraceae bacterium]
MKNRSNRTRRILAFFLDYLLFYLPCTLVVAILKLPVWYYFALSVAVVAAIGFWVAFIMRDYLLGGRSIGKQLFKLKVVDADTQAEPTAKQLIVKNLFLFLNLLDALFLLFSGRSLGERASRTLVLHEQQLHCDDTIPDYEKTSPPAKKRIAVLAKTVLCIAIPFFLIATFSLGAAKKQESYQTAYAYLVNSDTFAEMQVDESEIALTGYSSTTQLVNEDDSESVKVAFTFLVQGKAYQIVCHQDGDVW